MKINIKLVIFSVLSGKLKIFLPDNKLLAGELETNKSLDQSAQDLFGEKVGRKLNGIYFEQLYTFSSYKPQEISIVYYFLLPEHKIYSDMRNWSSVDTIKINKNDKDVIDYAVQRLQWKIEYTNAVYSLLPDEFTFSELQSAYEAILGKTLDKRNFHKKIMALNLLKSTGHKKREGRARPAQLYAFRTRKLSYVTILR